MNAHSQIITSYLINTPASSSRALFFAWQRRAPNLSDWWWSARDHGILPTFLCAHIVWVRGSKRPLLMPLNNKRPLSNRHPQRIALMHVYVTQANFTTKPRFEIKNKRSFTEMNSQGSRVEKNTHAQKVQMQKILFTNEACWWNLLVWRNHA